MKLSQVKRRKARGSSVIEVLMAITLVAIGASGVMAMQKVTVTANRNARDLEIANEIARTWVERVRIDAMVWNEGGNLTNTAWIGPNLTGTWFRPQYAGSKFPTLTGMHNALGYDWSDAAESHPFCVNLRLVPMEAAVSATTIRAEVRVYWLKSGMGGWASAPAVKDFICSDPSGADVEAAAVRPYFHVIHLTTLVVYNPK